MKKRYRLKKSVKRVIAILVMIYLAVGICLCAVDSHINPERHEKAVREGILFSWE